MESETNKIARRKDIRDFPALFELIGDRSNQETLPAVLRPRIAAGTHHGVAVFSISLNGLRTARRLIASLKFSKPKLMPCTMRDFLSKAPPAKQ
jgi:hypothetical protein